MCLYRKNGLTKIRGKWPKEGKGKEMKTPNPEPYLFVINQTNNKSAAISYLIQLQHFSHIY